MPLRCVDQVCHPESSTNADGWYCDEVSAVLLDGATPKAQTTLSTFANDTVWLVRRFLALWPGSAGLGDAAERAERVRLALRAEYDALCAGAGAVPDDAPFACLAIVLAAGEQLQLSNMGDLTLLVRAHDGSVRRFGDSAVRELDQRAIAGLERARARGVAPHAERLRAIAPELAEHRALRNVLPGYEVLEPAVSCLDRFQRFELARRDTRGLLMMSDGFYRLVDTFQCYSDRSLFDAVERRGLGQLLDELRAIERADEQCLAPPRFKTHDDATALWLELC